MNWKRAGLVLTLIILGVVFLLNRKEVVFTGQDGFAVQPLSGSGMELKSVLHLKNPNLLSTTIKKVHLRFSINGVQVGEVENELNQGIPGMKETEFPLGVRFSADDYHLLTAGNIPVLIKVEGEIAFNNFVNSGTIRVSQQAELKR